ncbi:MAG: hypothetical protein ACRDNK_22270, partial [Solirubrobacteraceae bacterium]
HQLPEISTGASLAVIILILLITTAASLARARSRPHPRAHAGSLHTPRTSHPANSATPPRDRATASR